MSPNDMLHDRRAWVRHACDLGTFCQPPKNGTVKQWTARIRDISRGGIQLVMEHWIVPGTILTIQLEESPGGELCELAVQVIFAMALPEGRWALGCRFISQLSDARLKEILGKE